MMQQQPSILKTEVHWMDALRKKHLVKTRQSTMHYKFKFIIRVLHQLGNPHAMLCSHTHSNNQDKVLCPPYICTITKYDLKYVQCKKTHPFYLMCTISTKHRSLNIALRYDVLVPHNDTFSIAPRGCTTDQYPLDVHII